MYREFGLVGIYQSLIDRRIDLEFTLDVHPDSATLDALALADKRSGRIIPLDILVDRNVVTMQLKEWPQAQTEYMIRIQSGQIRSIVDDELPDSIQRTIVFKSEVLSTVEILSPSHHEELTELRIAWQEIPDETDGSLVSSYYLEVAKENAFYNIVKSSMVTDKQEIKLTDISDGQYYVRVRAQKGDDYGRWSKTITFLIKGKTPTVVEEPIFERPLKIIKAPENGETQQSFVFTFNKEIDVDFMPSITIKRRPI